MQPPPGFCTPKKVWKLNKSLYGLKQSPRCWSKKINEVLAEIGFHPTRSDKCIFVRSSPDAPPAYILVYVDDCLISTVDPDDMKKIKEQLKARLDIKDLGPIATFLGLDFTDKGDYFSVSQKRYIEELIERFNLTEANPIPHLPAIDKIDMSNDEIDEDLPVRSLIGALLFIANMTRPDVSAAVSILSRYADRPSARVWKYSKLVLRYLNTTSLRSLALGRLNESSLEVYADANFAPDGDRKSQSGALIKLAGS